LIIQNYRKDKNMTLLPTNSNNPINIFGGQSLFDKLMGGTIGAIYGSKDNGVMGGILGGYAGTQNPNSLYERLMDKYLPNRKVLTIEGLDGLGGLGNQSKGLF
jgi:uncharacterized membrane protein